MMTSMATIEITRHGSEQIDTLAENVTTTIPIATTVTTITVNSNPQLERTFWMNRRRMLLNEVDNIERALEISLRTSEIRRLIGTTK